MFSLVFAVNAIGLVTAAQFAPNLIRRFGAERLVLAGSGVVAAAALVPFVAELAHHDTLAVLLPRRSS